MDIKFDTNAIQQAVINATMNELLFSFFPGTDKKTERMIRKFFEELNSRGVSTQTIIECLLESAKEQS